MQNCQQCGEPTPKDGFSEGVCVACYNENQHSLDLHNAQYDHWQRLTDAERESAIWRAIRNS
jgi:hypothetical protein